MKKFSNEVKVGIFFFACVAGFLYLILSTGKLHVRDEGYNVYVVFDDVSGIQKNSPVMVNGLEVGRVQQIDVSYNEGQTQVKLKLLINKGIKIWADPKITIKTLGLMGEKFIQIASSKGEAFIKPGSLLEGTSSMDLDVLMEEAEGISENLDSLIVNVNSLTDEVKKLAKNLNYTVEANQDRITAIIENLEATTGNFEEFSQDIKLHPWKILHKGKEKK
ncbi:MAG: MCE family protein [Candidatus Omnitrophica bacterium]|nr:MCE family protein [Candidatus Omnitrophota bacterium]